MVIKMAERYERIRNLREDSDLTQAEIGKQINVPQRTYAYYESGERMTLPSSIPILLFYLLEKVVQKALAFENFLYIFTV